MSTFQKTDPGLQEGLELRERVLGRCFLFFRRNISNMLLHWMLTQEFAETALSEGSIVPPILFGVCSSLPYPTVDIGHVGFY